MLGDGRRWIDRPRASTVMRRCRRRCADVGWHHDFGQVAVASGAAKLAAAALVNVDARREEKVDGVSQLNIVEQMNNWE